MHWKTKLTVLFFSLVILVGMGCEGGSKKPGEKQPTPEEMIAKSWRLTKMSMQEQLGGPGLMATSSFTFYKNGRYEILLGDLERGKWSLSANKKVLLTQKDGMDKAVEMDIVTLTPTKLVFVNTGNANPMTMELAPM